MSLPASPDISDSPDHQPKGTTMTTSQTSPSLTSDSPRPGGGIRWATAIVGGLITVAVLAVSAVGGGSLFGTATTTTRESIPASVRSITVDNAVGDVRVTRTAGAEASVQVVVDGLPWNRDDRPVIEVDGDEFTVSAGENRGCWFFCSRSMTVLVELGSLRIDELELADDVGDVTVADVDATSIDATSNVGRVTVHASATTTSVEASTDVGDVIVTVPAGVDYAVRASTDVGEIVNDIPATASTSHEIQASANVGTVRLSVR